VILIALLVAVAVPALRRAQARAKMMRCRHNLQQIHVALQGYAVSYSGALPTNAAGGEAVMPFPPGRADMSPITADVSSNVIGTKSDPRGLGKLREQLNDDLRVLFCPNDGRRNPGAYRQKFLNDQMLDNGDLPDCSYLYRGRDAWDATDTASARLFDTRRDSVRALVMDYYHTGMSRRYHGDRICILFEDGATLDVAVDRGSATNRFVDPKSGPAALDAIWRLADTVYESDD